jgi:hypothetical protein
MSGNSTGRSKHNDVDPNEKSSVAALDRRGGSSPATSNIKIRRATGQAHRPPPPRPTEAGAAADSGPGEPPAVPVEAPTGGRRHRRTSSTAQVDDRQERSGPPVRSRRWVQLRSATTRTSDARGTDAAKSGHGGAIDNDTKPKASRRTATASRAAKHKNLQSEALTKPADTQASDTASCCDPLTSLWELALLPTRMTMAATTEAMKMLTSSDDATRESVMCREPQIDGRDASG